VPALAAAPVAAEENLGALDDSSSVLVLDLKPTNAEPELSQIVTDLVAVSLGDQRAFRVLTSSDVRSALAVEAQKEAMGCDDESCLAEVAGAMGADYVVHGTVGLLGELTVVTMNLFDSSRAVSVGRATAQARDQAELPSAIDDATRKLVADVGPTGEHVTPHEDPATPIEPNTGNPYMSPLFLVGGPLAVVGVLGATGLGIGAAVMSAQLADGGASFEERESAKGLGQILVVGAGVSGALAVVGAGLAVVAFIVE
jgi:hypothetical protein